MDLNHHNKRKGIALAMLFLGLPLLHACGGASDANPAPTQSSNSPVLSMGLPDSLTGGTPTAAPAPGKTAQTASAKVTAQADDLACAYIGPEDDSDPFRNGYEMTKFMVSAMAAWTCVADTLIEISALLPHNGTVAATDNVLGAPGYDPDDPTHYSITDESETQSTIRLFYGYASDTPPTGSELAGFYLSWDTANSAQTNGRLIIDVTALNSTRAVDDPTQMRMDFVSGEDTRSIDMFIRFDDGNEWADGMRIVVDKDLTANPFEQVFLARGLFAMKRQFQVFNNIAELPNLAMVTVADRFGEGAAIAEFQNMGLGLPINLTNHLGEYLFTKTDRYFFDADQSAAEPWDWIDKSITSAEYRGGRTTPATGGTWIPFDPSQDMIITALGLDSDYFTGIKCANLGDDCTPFLNAVFMDGFAGQESNQGADPMDWRSTALASPQYLTQVYPNGVNWNGAFEQTYTP